MTKLDNLFKSNRFKKNVLNCVCVLFLAALSFVVLYPFIGKISSVFMSSSDLKDPTVWLIPKNPTFDNIINVIKYSDFWGSLKNTFIFAFVSAVLQSLSSTVVAYGLSHFKFKGKTIVILLVVLTLIVPPQVLFSSMYTKFRFFDFFGIARSLGLPTLNLQNTFAPMFMLSATCLGLKCGLFILILIQQFNAVPKELSEAAKVDGAGVFRTFALINFPQVRAVMVSVFLLSFAWLWADTFYTGVFFRNEPIFTNLVSDVSVIYEINAIGNSLSGIMMSTAVMLMLIPLIIVYLLGQKALIQGIQSSGIVG